MMRRRRFIQIVAAAALAPEVAAAQVRRWTGRAMGADVSLVLYGADPGTLDRALDLIRAAEARFSLHDPGSELVRLNAAGGGRVSSDMARLLDLAARMHHATEGLFDPTIQPVFDALLRGAPAPWDLVGWNRLKWDGARLALASGQALSLNGIAQGDVTDQVRNHLADQGLDKALVNIGEHAAIGGPFRLGLEDPVHGLLGQISLSDSALATSSPGAMLLGNRSHILHPAGGAPCWSTVSVRAQTAVVADAVSTGLCLAPIEQAKRIARRLGVAVTLVDDQGDITRV